MIEVKYNTNGLYAVKVVIMFVHKSHKDNSWNGNVIIDYFNSRTRFKIIYNYNKEGNVLIPELFDLSVTWE